MTPFAGGGLIGSASQNGLRAIEGKGRIKLGNGGPLRLISIK